MTFNRGVRLIVLALMVAGPFLVPAAGNSAAVQKAPGMCLLPWHPNHVILGVLPAAWLGQQL